MAKLVTNIMEITVGSIFAAALIPTAIGQFMNTSTVGWNPAAAAVWALLSIVSVLAVAMGFLGLVTSQE